MYTEEFSSGNSRSGSDYVPPSRTTGYVPPKKTVEYTKDDFPSNVSDQSGQYQMQSNLNKDFITNGSSFTDYDYESQIRQMNERDNRRNSFKQQDTYDFNSVSVYESNNNYYMGGIDPK